MDTDFDHLDGEWALLPDQHQRTIVHIDIDCFYAQVEMVRNPELRDKPVGVKQKDLMVTCNYKARSMGVKKSMWITDAMKALPSLVLIDGSDLAPYRQVSADITSIALSFTSLVERLGLDENYLDVTEKVSDYMQNECNEIVGHWYGDKDTKQMPVVDPCGCGCYKRLVIGSHIASDLRKKILEATGITCCAGIAHNKLLAKLVSGYHKPNEQTLIFPWQVYDLMNSLEFVRCIPGIGWATSRTLCDMQIASVQDLQSADIEALKTKFDADTCRRIKAMSYGIDEAAVRLNSRPQSLGVEDAVKRTSVVPEVREKYQVLLDRLLKLLADDGREPATIKVSARRRFEHRMTKQFSLSSSLFTKGVKNVIDSVKSNLMDLIMNTFLKMIDTSKPFELTLLGIGFTKLIDRGSDNKLSISRFFQKRSHDQIEHLCGDSDEQKWLKDASTSGNSMNTKKPKVEVSHQRKSFFRHAEEKQFISSISGESSQYIAKGTTLASTELGKPEGQGSALEKIDIIDSVCPSDKTVVCEDHSGNANKDESHNEVPCLPEDIDSDVFYSLPKEIQEEILKSYRDDKSNENPETHLATEPVQPGSKKGNSEAQSSFANYFRPIKTSNSSSANMEKHEDFCGYKIQDSNENGPSCSFSVKSDVHNKVLDRLPPSSKKVPNDAECSECDILLPEGIDVDVFSALPKELQQEILEEQRNKRRFSSPLRPLKSSPHKRKSVQSSPILKYFKKM